MKDYAIISESDFQKARNAIRKNKDSGKIIVFHGSDEMNRKVLEKEKIDILLLKVAGRKDRIKQRDSGFNHVIAKLAKKKDVTIGIYLDEIINSDKKEKVKILARIRQNIEICRKEKLKMIFISLQHQKDIYDLKALGLVLGMPTFITKNL